MDQYGTAPNPLSEDFSVTIQGNDPIILRQMLETPQTAEITYDYPQASDIGEFWEAENNLAQLQITSSDIKVTDCHSKFPAKTCPFPGCTSTAKFRRNCDLRKHVKQHSRTLFCRVIGCPKSQSQRIDKHIGWFATAKDRNRHEAKHNPKILCWGLNPDGSCCNRVFSRKDNMIAHMRRIHGLLLTPDATLSQEGKSFPWADRFLGCDEPLGQGMQLQKNVSGIRGYLQWLKANTGLEKSKLDAAVPKIEEAAILLEQIPCLTKEDLLGIGLPLGIVIALQQNYELYYGIQTVI